MPALSLGSRFGGIDVIGVEKQQQQTSCLTGYRVTPGGLGWLTSQLGWIGRCGSGAGSGAEGCCCNCGRGGSFAGQGRCSGRKGALQGCGAKLRVSWNGNCWEFTCRGASGIAAHRRYCASWRLRSSACNLAISSCIGCMARSRSCASICARSNIRSTCLVDFNTSSNALRSAHEACWSDPLPASCRPARRSVRSASVAVGMAIAVSAAFLYRVAQPWTFPLLY